MSRQRKWGIGHLVMLVVLVCGVSHAQSPTSWEPLQGAGNAHITVVATTPATSTMAVVGYTNGDVYLGFNAEGENPNWTQVDDKNGTPYTSLPDNTVTAVAISPFDTQSYYVAFAGCHYPNKLWKTGNGGEWFIPLENAPFCDISSISVNPVDPAIVYVISAGDLYVSTDYGQTWDQGTIFEPLLPPLAQGDRISAVSAARNNHYSSNEDYIVGTVMGDVWMTLDGGMTWTKLDDMAMPGAPDLPNRMVTSVVFDDRLIPPAFYVSYDADPMPNDRDALWSSMNGGKYWLNIYNEGLPDNSAVGMISTNPAYFGTLYATTGNYLTITNAAKSEDNGNTWNSGCTCDTGCNDAAITPENYFGTTDARCFAINGDITGWSAWNLQGRNIVVNGEVVTPGAPLPEKINDRYYFYFTAGDFDYAGWTLW